MINFRYVFHLLECGHFCIDYVLKKEGKRNVSNYEKKLMPMALLKSILSEYFMDVNCYRICQLGDIKNRFITVILNKNKSLHYIVVEKIQNNSVYYYDPLYITLRRVKLSKFERKWCNYCCFYS